VCARHDTPLLFSSMYGGEKFSYADMLLKKFIQDKGQLRKYHVAYDLGCKYIEHLKTPTVSRYLKDSTIKVTVPAMHVIGHGDSCVRWLHPKRNEGLGHTDGEGSERLWSHTGPYHNITKEMSPYKRIEQLEDIMRDVRIGKITRLAPQLRKKLYAIDTVLARTRLDFEKLNITELDARSLWKQEQLSYENKAPIFNKNTEGGLRLHIQAKILETSFYKHDIHSRSTPGKRFISLLMCKAGLTLL